MSTERATAAGDLVTGKNKIMVSFSLLSRAALLEVSPFHHKYFVNAIYFSHTAKTAVARNTVFLHILIYSRGSASVCAPWQARIRSQHLSCFDTCRV
jgi:hypothetical protein